MIEYYKNKSLQPLFYVNEQGLICQEIFKDIPNYEGFYQASDLGRIKSLSRLVKRKIENNYYISEKIISQSICSNYLSANLHKQGFRCKFLTHILVATTFLNHVSGNPNEIVDHIKKGNTLDNRLSNLQIITQRQNSTKDKTNGSSQYVGVHWNKKDKRWISYIRINGIKIYLGCFTDELEAYNAYQLALKNWENLGIIPNKKASN